MKRKLTRDLRSLIERRPSVFTDGKGAIDGWRKEQGALIEALRNRKNLYEEYLKSTISVPYGMEYLSKEEDYKDFFYSRSYFEGVMKFRFYVRRILEYYRNEDKDDEDILDYEYMMLSFKRDFERIE